MGLLQLVSSTRLRGPKVCGSFYCHGGAGIMMMLRSSISTFEWEARQANPSGPELNFDGSCSRRSKEAKQWPRPTAIPWQVKVANAVHLIGTINAPVEIIHVDPPKIRAATMLVKKSPSPFNCLGIRLIFEDDLAETAACYLKLGDSVYVSGQLDADSQCSTNEKKQSVAKVVVKNLNFVKRDFPSYSYEKGDVMLNKTDKENSPSPAPHCFWTSKGQYRF